MAFCGLYQPAYLLLQEDIRLKQDLKNKDEFILGFSSVAAAKAKHLYMVNSSYCISQSTECSTAVALREVIPGPALSPPEGSR